MPPLPTDSSKTAALKRGLRKTSCIPKSKNKKIVSLVSLHRFFFQNYEKDERMASTRKKKSGQMKFFDPDTLHGKEIKENLSELFRNTENEF